ncbi:MAG: iron donor protein CyaY [Kofleriaceae bacterium]|nr:iron donor protein CyaY [Kofleriaceae bacterium]
MVRMDDVTFDKVAREELHSLEDAFSDIDPDEVEVSTSDGVLRLDLRDGTRIVINSHRAARQIWMAAVASAWHFDPVEEGVWRSGKSGEELRPTLQKLLRERIGLELAL